MDDEIPLLVADEAPLNADDAIPPIPVILLTGLLGCGKTTFIHSVLSSADTHRRRVAIVMNDYDQGADLERQILIGKLGNTHAGWISLNNGCLCCSLKDVSVRAVEIMVEQAYRTQNPIDIVIVEVAGNADPLPVVTSFWLDDALQSCLRLHGVLAILDTPAFIDNLSNHLVDRQVAMADHILLNKLWPKTIQRYSTYIHHIKQKKISKKYRAYSVG